MAKYYLVSFPKSGRTWLRFMIEQYGYDRPIKYIHGFGHPYLMVPDEITTPNVSRIERWILIKKWILMFRDPRDVIISSYFERTRRGHFWNYRYDGTLKEYIREERGSYVTLLAFMEQWATFALQQKTRCIVVRYEDVLSRAPIELARILKFMHVPVEESRLLRAAEVASFENMRKLECGFGGKPELLRESRLANTPKLAPGDSSDLESFKTRRGGHGGYTNYLDEDDTVFVNKLMKDAKRIMAEPCNYAEFL